MVSPVAAERKVSGHAHIATACRVLRQRFAFAALIIFARSWSIGGTTSRDPEREPTFPRNPRKSRGDCETQGKSDNSPLV
jgi:hypothetical protein